MNGINYCWRCNTGCCRIWTESGPKTRFSPNSLLCLGDQVAFGVGKCQSDIHPLPLPDTLQPLCRGGKNRLFHPSLKYVVLRDYVFCIHENYPQPLGQNRNLLEDVRRWGFPISINSACKGNCLPPLRKKLNARTVRMLNSKLKGWQATSHPHARDSLFLAYKKKLYLIILTMQDNQTQGSRR